MRNLSFRQRQLFVILGLILLLLVIEIGVALPSSRNAIIQSARTQLETVAELRSVQIRHWLNQGQEVARLVSKQREIEEGCRQLLNAPDPEQAASARQDLRARLEGLSSIFAHVKSISLLHPTLGQVLISTDLNQESRVWADKDYFQRGRKSLYVSPVVYSVGREAPVLMVGAPVPQEGGTLAAVVAVEMHLADLQALLGEQAGSDQTGRTYVVDAYGFYVTSPDPDQSTLHTIAKSEGVRRVLEQQNGSDMYTDPRGTRVLGVYRWLPEGKLGLLVETKESRVTGRIMDTWKIIGLLSIAILTLAFVVAHYLTNRLVAPLEAITQATHSLRAGDLGHRTPMGGPDEIAQLARAFNTMAAQLQRHYENLEGLVAQRTYELRKANAQLEQEINERIQAERALRESEERYRSVVEYSHAGIMIVDQNYRFTYANDMLCQILGYPRQEIIDQDFRKFLSAESREQVAVRYQRRQRGERVRPHYQATLIRQDGQKRRIEVSAALIRDAKNDQYTVGQILDITERVQAEEQLRRYTRELEQRNEELDAFAHTVAHDLKDVLAPVVGFAETLEDQFQIMPHATLQKYLSSIARSGRKMKNIVDELLLLAGVRKKDVQLAELEMAPIVNEALQRLDHMIKAHQAEVILPPANSWPLAQGYAPWIEEVWINYISNAIKYGGHPPRLELGANGPLFQKQIQAGLACFWVRDNGSGLTEAQQAQLFAPFTQITQTQAQGHGLGLSIVQRIVEKLDGEVGVWSEKGPHEPGSIFYFALPKS